MYSIIDTNGKLTKIGDNVTHFSSLSINRILFLVYAYQTYCAREASIILAMMDALNGKFSNLFFKSDTICNSSCAKPAGNKLLEKMMDKKGDHLTFLKIYQEYMEQPQDDQKIWARKYGIRLDLLNKAKLTVNNYYYKIVNLHRTTQSRVSDAVGIKQKLVEALKHSHRHLTAKKMSPIFSRKEIDGHINKDSALFYFYKNKNLATKNFVYDELVNINGKWEFNIVTLI